jgi:GT2 family glycosyltransferase
MLRPIACVNLSGRESRAHFRRRILFLQETGRFMTRIAVIIASLGRRDVVADLLDTLERQTRRADRIVVSVTKPEDAPKVAEGGGVEVLISPIGSCAQRNAGLDHLKDSADIIVFFDDDFIPASDYLEQLERFFDENPHAAGVTGNVLKDGVTGTGITLKEALQIIENHPAIAVDEEPFLEKRLSLYGCNMAFRREAIENLRFDERLPLYGWLEDVDFSMQAKRFGPVMRTNALQGVHLGVKGGRTSGKRFGYSQIMNPFYLYRKKTITLHHAFDNLWRNIASNHVRLFFPEPHIDRWGRVKGNWIAFYDILRGRITPERILTF